MPFARYFCIFINVGLGEGSALPVGVPVPWPSATPPIPAPLKRLLPDYKRMEEKIDAVIREKYGLPPVMSTPVKYADLIMLATERRDLGLDDGSFWPVLEGIPATEMFKVIPQAPGHAYGMFMERFNELSELRKCA